MGKKLRGGNFFSGLQYVLSWISYLLTMLIPLSMVAVIYCFYLMINVSLAMTNGAIDGINSSIIPAINSLVDAFK